MPTRSADLRLAGLLGVVSLGLVVALRLGAGLWGAMGTDAPLWGLTAMDLRVGAAPLVPPLYPALIGILERLGLGLVSAGQVISGLAASLVGPAVYLSAREAGATRAPAVLAALLCLASPDLGAWSQQVQPDSLAALALVLTAGALSAHLRSPRLATGASLAALATLFPLLREHGVPIAGLVTLVLGLAPGGRAWAGAALLGWTLGPVLLGLAPGWHPLDQPWGSRAGGALGALQADSAEAVPYIRELHREARRAYLQLVVDGDRLGQVRWHAGRSLALAADGWLILGAAVLGAAARPRARALALPLVVALPALLIWSQRRHVLLVLPVALAVLAVAASARRPPRAPAAGTSARPGPWWVHGLAAVGSLVVLATLAPRWPGTVAGLQSERPRAEHYAELGRWICTHTPETVLLGGIFQDVGLYCPRPRHDPDGTPADWHTIVVSDRPPASHEAGSWEVVFQGSGALMAHRLVPPGGTTRPCPTGRPAPQTAHLAIAAAHAEWIGCSGPAARAPSPAE